jgi:hypothetical protein
MVMGYKDDKYIEAYETFSFTYSLESYTMGAGLALGVRGPIVLCKTCSLLLWKVSFDILFATSCSIRYHLFPHFKLSNILFSS